MPNNPQGVPPRPAKPSSMDEERSGLPKSRLILYGILFVAALIVYRKMSAEPPPAPSPPQAVKKDKQGKQPRAKAAWMRDSLRRPDSTRRAAGAAFPSSTPSGPRVDYADKPAPEDLRAYEFVRAPWESPSSPALAERVNRMDEGYVRHPMARFHGVEGRLVFIRHSMGVNPSPDRKLDRVPEKAIAEYLPGWYQRGFTLHLKGHLRPFLPMQFRLKEPPGPKPPEAPGQEALVYYAVHAYVDAEDAVLIYPDTEPKEGPNGWVGAEELRLDSIVAGFGATYFRSLTRGPVEAVRTFSLPDREYRLVEVHARRTSPGKAPADTLRGHKGVFTFLIDPRARKIAFLAHDFDQRFCQRDKDIRFRGVVDVAGDETAEILLGPKPHVLVHEDMEGLKYHFEEGYTCEETGA